jgi:hypothetical protein
VKAAVPMRPSQNLAIQIFIIQIPRNPTDTNTILPFKPEIKRHLSGLRHFRPILLFIDAFFSISDYNRFVSILGREEK